MKRCISLFLILVGILRAETAGEPQLDISNAVVFDTTLLLIEEPKLETAGPAFDLEIKEKKYFSYFSLGTCGFVLPIGPEFSIGWRKLNSRHAWDVQGGASLMLARYFWGQVSYLHFFLPTTGSYSSPYLGVGITVGHMRQYTNDYIAKKIPVYGNIPVTIGYQFGKEERNQFFQVQFTPLLITTLSYGVGF